MKANMSGGGARKRTTTKPKVTQRGITGKTKQREVENAAWKAVSVRTKKRLTKLDNSPKSKASPAYKAGVGTAKNTASWVMPGYNSEINAGIRSLRKEATKGMTPAQAKAFTKGYRAAMNIRRSAYNKSNPYGEKLG